MKVKTSELTATALDWAVAKCENLEIHPPQKDMKIAVRNGEWEPWWVFTPSTSWAQGGPILEREGISISSPRLEEDDRDWQARALSVSSFMSREYKKGDTPLEAAMRCYVASKLSEWVDVPEQLL